MQRDQNLLNLAAFSAAALGVLGVFIAGCASPSGTTAQPKPGTGIAEYRELTREARQAVAATLQSLEALPHPANAAPPSALAGFDRSLEKLERTSFKTRSRAEAIIARGQAYFDEWKANLAGVTNPASARVETEHYGRLLEHFGRVRERSGEVRTEFRPFMIRLREFRATLDLAPNTAGGESSRVTVGLLTASGRRVLESLDAVSKALDDAETELRAALAAKR